MNTSNEHVFRRKGENALVYCARLVLSCQQLGLGGLYAAARIRPCMFITKLDNDGNVAGPRPREPGVITRSTASLCDCPSRGRGVKSGSQAGRPRWGSPRRRRSAQRRDGATASTSGSHGQYGRNGEARGCCGSAITRAGRDHSEHRSFVTSLCDCPSRGRGVKSGSQAGKPRWGSPRR